MKSNRENSSALKRSENTLRVLLMGSPNVGKSVVFSRLTGTHVTASNYAGTTVELTRGRLRIDGRPAELIDVPGTYSLQPSNRAEEVALKMLQTGDIIVNIVDSTNLERNLNLTLQLIKTGKPVVIALNMWDEAVEHGIEIDYKELEKILGVPVVPTCAISGEGIKALTESLKKVKTPKPAISLDDVWDAVGGIIARIQNIKHKHPTVLQKLEHASVHPFTGPFIALIVLLFSVAFVAYAGEFLAEQLMERLFMILWLPVVNFISGLLAEGGFAHKLLIGSLIEGEIDFEQSFGLLTTGIFIPITVVLPFIFCFYFVLSLLEDIGYLPRLGTLVDTIMHRLGLHGFSIVPMMLGFGCNVPGALAGRILETRKERFIALTLISICIPCMAQIAMVIGLLGQTGFRGLGIVFLTLFILWLALGVLMKFFLRGETPEILLEIPPYRLPSGKTLLKKIYMRVMGFIKEALPYVLLGVFIVNLLYTLGIIASLSRTAGPVISKLFGLPGEAVGALIIGFLRKDVAVGMLAPLGLTTAQLIVASVVLIIYFPCAATFVVLFKELGFKDLIKSTAVMIISAVSVGTALNSILKFLKI
jgi:ferrous iron transport protein B